MFCLNLILFQKSVIYILTIPDVGETPVIVGELVELHSNLQSPEHTVGIPFTYTIT